MDRRLATTLAAYAVGLWGWVWDDLEHLGRLDLGAGAGPAHLLMYLSGLLALTALVPPESRAWLAARGSGVLLVIVGIIVDIIWHATVESGSEEGANMLLMPGHTIQLAGWVLGAVLSCAVVIRSLTTSQARAV